MADILHRVGIKSPAEKVYRALTTREGLASWWTTRTQGDGQPGSVFHFDFSNDGVDIGSMDMKVLELEAPTQVQWEAVAGPQEWIGTRIHWALRQGM